MCAVVLHSAELTAEIDCPVLRAILTEFAIAMKYKKGVGPPST